MQPAVFPHISGLAMFRDLETKHYKEILAHLEREQASFLRFEKDFRGSDYRWPRDALHNWSRLWEYPFAFHHITSLLPQLGQSTGRVLDFGSGVTFFPFALAHSGIDVVCCDNDPICVRDIGRAANALGTMPGKVSATLIDGMTLPFAANHFSLIYCISVLEHLERPEEIVAEMARCLINGGVLVLTIDIDLKGTLAIGPADHERLHETLFQYFELVAPLRPIHPAALLTSQNSPVPFVSSGLISRAAALVRDIARIAVGRKAKGFPPFHLAVEGLILRKREFNELQD